MIESYSLFAGMNERLLNELRRFALIKTFPKGKVLFVEGDSSDSLYVILSGKLKAIVAGRGGKEIILSIMGPGEYFGEIALFDGEPRSATVVVKEDSEVMVLTRTQFKNMLSDNPDIAMDIISVLIKRLRRATKKIRSLAFMDVYARVVSCLNQLSEEIDDHQVIDGKWTHSEIGKMVGTSREMVTRVMKNLEVRGYISQSRNRIAINKGLPSSLSEN